MIQRCTNPKNKDFARYGGRGVYVCPDWLSFDCFLADMGEPPAGMTLGRIDNVFGYSKQNCEWQSRRKQAGNTSRNSYIAWAGIIYCVAEWARQLGVNPKTFRARIRAHGVYRAMVMSGADHWAATRVAH